MARLGSRSLMADSTRPSLSFQSGDDEVMIHNPRVLAAAVAATSERLA
jgi:hypothetical protein